jgi:hypothetical protein
MKAIPARLSSLISRANSAARALIPGFGIMGMSAVAVTMPHTTAAPAHLDAKDVTRTDQHPVIEAFDASTRATVAKAQRADAALPTHTVKAGESFSSIASWACNDPGDWTGVYTASRWAHQTAKNANDIRTGQQVTIMCKKVPSMAGRAYTPPPPPVPHASLASHLAHIAHTEHEAATAHQAAPVEAAAAGGSASAASGPAVEDSHVSASGYSGIQECIVSRESGGQLNVMNASGHYGLYQFDLGTWESGGGNPADFGHASKAEQDQVFASVYAARGAEPWAPSDGC